MVFCCGAVATVSYSFEGQANYVDRITTFFSPLHMSIRRQPATLFVSWTPGRKAFLYKRFGGYDEELSCSSFYSYLKLVLLYLWMYTKLAYKVVRLEDNE